MVHPLLFLTIFQKIEVVLKSLLICNGNVPKAKFLRSIIKNYDAIACADGGANIAFKFGILPDFIIGDLDSIKQDVKKFFERKNVKIIHDTDQDSTDIEKSVKFLLSRGFTHIDIASAIGDRIDHNLGNLSVLVNFYAKAKLKIIDETMEIFFTKDKITFKTNKGDSISLIPLGLKADGVKTKGLKFKLNNETLIFSGRGVSNVAMGKRVSIEIKRGGLFVIRKITSPEL